jgi:hypothetical protein
MREWAPRAPQPGRMRYCSTNRRRSRSRRDPMPAGSRHLVIVLGDQLDAGASSFDGFDPARDRIWMAEVAGESEHVWPSKPRTALFLSAMRHFAQGLHARRWPFHYVHLDDERNRGSLAAELEAAIAAYRPQRLVMTHPGGSSHDAVPRRRWCVWRSGRSPVPAPCQARRARAPGRPRCRAFDTDQSSTAAGSDPLGKVERGCGPEGRSR